MVWFHVLTASCVFLVVRSDFIVLQGFEKCLEPVHIISVLAALRLHPLIKILDDLGITYAGPRLPAMEFIVSGSLFSFNRPMFKLAPQGQIA